MTKTVREVMADHFGEDFEEMDYYAWSIKKGNRYIEGDKDLLVVCKAWRDSRYAGNEPMFMANYAVLQDEWSHLEGFNDGSPRGWDANYITLELDSPAGDDPFIIMDALEILEEVGYLDDGDYYSAAEEEIRDEHWEDYGCDELRDALEAKFGEDAEDLDNYQVRDIAGEWWYGEGEWPEIVDPSYVDFHVDKIVEDLTLEQFKAMV